MMDATLKETPDDTPQELFTHYNCGECDYMARKKKFVRKHQMEVGHAGMRMVLKAKGHYNPFKVPDQVEEPAGVVRVPNGQLLEQVDEPFATIVDESASHVDKKKKKKKNKTKPDPEPAEEPSGHVPKKKKVKKSKSVEPEPESPPRKEYQCKVCDKIKRS